MDDVNPYAAPRTPNTRGSIESSWDRLWRDNRYPQDLTMHKDARLPNRCVKTGVETTTPGIKRKFSWHNPWIAITVLFIPLIYIIAASVASKKATIEVPLSEQQAAKRKNRLTAWWIIGIASVAILLGCLVVVLDSNPANVSNVAVAGVIFGFIGMLTALIAGQSVARILRPTKITKTMVRLRGVHPSIVEQLPLLPDDMR